MDKNAMRGFLSERNLELHVEYLENLRLKTSIFVKSGVDIAGKSLRELSRMRLGVDKEEILALAKDVYYHELYFASFGMGGSRAAERGSRYSSVAGFLYELERAAMRHCGGFLLVYQDGEGAIIGHSSEPPPRRAGEPRLALDLCEHAYFLDYGFDKLSYVRAALARLELSKIDKI